MLQSRADFSCGRRRSHLRAALDGRHTPAAQLAQQCQTISWKGHKIVGLHADYLLEGSEDCFCIKFMFWIVFVCRPQAAFGKGADPVALPK